MKEWEEDQDRVWVLGPSRGVHIPSQDLQGKVQGGLSVPVRAMRRPIYRSVAARALRRMD